MLFDIWPECFRERANGYLQFRVLGYSLALLSMVLMILFLIQHNDLFLVFSLVIIMFAGGMLYRYHFVRNHFSAKVEFSDWGISVRDYNKRLVLNSVSYNQISNIEKKHVRISDCPKGGWLAEFSEHDIIIVYKKPIRSFDELGLEKYVPENGFWGIDVFYNDNCVAFAYDESAWLLLERHRVSDDI